MNADAAIRKRIYLIIACGAVILTLAMGVRHSAGLFLQPMTLAQGWSRETYAFAIAIQNLVWGLGSPFFGAVADRYGATRTLVVGGLLYVLGLVLMAHSSTGAELTINAGIVIGLGMSATTFTVVLGAIGRHVPAEKRSLAFGIGSAGGSFGQFAVLPAGQAMISHWGWQAALYGLAAGIVLIVPLALMINEKTVRQAHHGDQSIKQALCEAAASGSFHLLFWSYFVCGFQTAFITLHLPSSLVDAGMSATVGMTAVALIGLFNIFGSFGSGWLGGRFSKKKLLAFIYFTRAIAIAAFLMVPVSATSAYAFAAVMGLLWLGTVPLTNGLVAHIFGLKFLSMLSGIVFLGHQIGSFLGAWLGGVIFDRSGSYLLAWLIALGLGVAAALLSWPINERSLRTPEGAPA